MYCQGLEQVCLRYLSLYYRCPLEIPVLSLGYPESVQGFDVVCKETIKVQGTVDGYDVA